MIMDTRTVLTQDERPITAVYFDGEDAGGYKIGQTVRPFGDDARTVIKIEAYAEKGQSSMVPWVAVYNEDGIIMRVAAEYVSIHY